MFEIIFILIAYWLYRAYIRTKPNLNQLAGKVVVITGGGSGIGREIALLCARNGAQVSICGRRTAKLEAVEQEIRDLGGECLSIRADCSVQDDVKHFIEQTVAKFGKIDQLYINHMWGRVQALQSIPEDELKQAYHDAYDTTVFGMMAITYYALPHLKITSGNIIQVSSMSAFYGVPKCSLYAGTKAAGHRFFDCLRVELGKRSNVAITVACPGLIDTDTARAYMPPTDMKGAMAADMCAKQIVEGGLERVREVHMNLVQKPPIFGPLVYYVSVLFPWAMDYIMYWSYDFEKGEGIRDAAPEYPKEDDE